MVTILPCSQAAMFTEIYRHNKNLLYSAHLSFVRGPIMTHPPYSKQLEEHIGGKEVRQVIDDEVAKQRNQMDEVVEEYKMK